MSDSDDENVLYAPTGKDAHHQGKGLLGNGVKNVNDILNGPSDNRRLKKTIALCGAFLGLGLALAVVGPTLKELQHHLHVDFPRVSFIFTGRSIGYVVGSIIGGMTFDSFHPLLLIALTLGMSGVGLLVTPYCQQLMASVLAISFVGVAMGALDTGANVVCLRMWGKKSAPFMQALHFSFALGAFVAPLLAGPFIGPVGPVLMPAPSAVRPSNHTTPPVPMMHTKSASAIAASGTSAMPPGNSTSNSSTPSPAPPAAVVSERLPPSSTAPDTSSSSAPSLPSTASSSATSTVVTGTSKLKPPAVSQKTATSSTASASPTASPTQITTVTGVTTTEENLTKTSPKKSSPLSSSTSENEMTTTIVVTEMITAESSGDDESTAESSGDDDSSTQSSGDTTPRETTAGPRNEEDTSRKRRDANFESRRLLSHTEEKKRIGDVDNEKVKFHADDDADGVRGNRKKRHWRSRIMLQASEQDDLETTTTTTTTTTKQTQMVSEPKERFQGVYVIIAVFLMLMALVFTFFFCTSPAQFKPSGGDSNLEATLKYSEQNFTHYILGLLFIFYFLYVGGEVGYGGYIYSFAIDSKTKVNFTSDDATHLNSVFWGTFALGRGVSICLASLISPLNMVLLDIVGCIVSSMALAYEANVNASVLWVGTATLGASMASLFPAGISWLESHAPVTGNVASFLIIGAAFGEMAVPLLLGFLFDSNVGPMSLMYVVLAISIATAGIFGCTVYLAAKEGRNYDPLPKEDVLEGLLMEVRSAIDDDDGPSKGKQSSKPILPKPLQAKKHKE